MNAKEKKIAKKGKNYEICMAKLPMNEQKQKRIVQKVQKKNSTKPGRHICIDNGKYFRVEII